MLLSAVNVSDDGRAESAAVEGDDWRCIALVAAAAAPLPESRTQSPNAASHRYIRAFIKHHLRPVVPGAYMAYWIDLGTVLFSKSSVERRFNNTHSFTDVESHRHQPLEVNRPWPHTKLLFTSSLSWSESLLSLLPEGGRCERCSRVAAGEKKDSDRVRRPTRRT